MSNLTVSDVLDLDYPDAPAWSADGSYLAVPVHEDDGQALRIAAVEGPADPWRVSPGDGSAGGLAWAPESEPKRLATVSSEGELFLLAAAAGTVEPLSGHADADDLAWTDDGRRVAFYRDGQPSVFDRERGTDRRFSVPERGTFLGESEMLAWGPTTDCSPTASSTPKPSRSSRSTPTTGPSHSTHRCQG